MIATVFSTSSKTRQCRKIVLVVWKAFARIVQLQEGRVNKERIVKEIVCIYTVSEICGFMSERKLSNVIILSSSSVAIESP